MTHPHATLAYFTDGCSTFEQKGIWNVSPGDVLLVPAGEPHRRSSDERTSYWGLGLSVPCYAQDTELQRINPFERVRDGGAAVVRIPAARRHHLEHLLTELAAVTREPTANLGVQRSLLHLVLNEVWSATSPTETSTNTVVNSSLRYIERHCLMPITLKDVAAAVGKSAAYVTTTLSQHTGQSAVEWIISGRMAEARRLLLHSSLPIGDIAYRVGYADATHFIRLFRRVHGLTPAAYRHRSAAERVAQPEPQNSRNK